jgi:hypothetical protein
LLSFFAVLAFLLCFPSLLFFFAFPLSLFPSLLSLFAFLPCFPSSLSFLASPSLLFFLFAFSSLLFFFAFLPYFPSLLFLTLPFGLGLVGTHAALRWRWRVVFAFFLFPTGMG